MPKTNPHRACNDFHQTSEATRRAFLDDGGAGMTRRQVIGRGVAGGLAIYAAQAMPFGRIFEAAEAAHAAAPNAPVLVSVFLPGGCDLLDTFVPLNQDGRYADLRPGLRQKDAPRLAGADLGVHPSLTKGLGGGVKGLFDAGKIGLMPGIDYANPDLSHFHSRHFWETGLVTQKAASGWLGRMLDRNGSMDNPLQGVSMTGSLSPVMRAGRAPVAAVSSPNSAQFWIPDVWGPAFDQAMGAWEEISRRGTSKPGAAAANAAALQAKQVADRLAPYKKEKGIDPLKAPVAYPDGNKLASRLQTLAGLIDQPLGIRVAAVEAEGDFDTHDRQGEDLARGLGNVSEALASFQADLEARGIADRVMTFVWSEFGRRPEQNDSDGTDHGAGGLAWVQGTQAKSGVLSEYPDLKKLDRQENLAVTLDFRRVYSSLLEQWMGVDAGAVIPDAAGFGRLALTR